MLSIAILLGLLALAITIICAFLITQLPRKTWIKFILIPIVLTVGCLSFFNVDKLMGYPYHGVPRGQFHVEAVRLGRVDDKNIIEFWALQHGGSRLYTIPYDPDIMATLRQALAAEKSGEGSMPLEFGQAKGAGGQGDGQSYSLEGHFDPLSKAMPPKEESDTPAEHMLGSPLSPPQH